MSLYRDLSIEVRDDDVRKRSKYDLFMDADERKDFFKHRIDSPAGKDITIGRSVNESDWDVRHYDKDDKETTKKEPFSKHSYHTVLEDYGIDASKVFDVSKPSKSSKPSKPSKSSKPSKPSKSAKPAKKPVKKVAKKTKPAKKGGAKKKSSRKPKKKSSRKPKKRSKKKTR